MEIIYPPLIEQGVAFFHPQSSQPMAMKANLYRQFVKQGILTETGEPTQTAIDKGWVIDFYEAEHLSFAEFLTLYPVFSQYDETVFKQIDGFWEVPVDFKEELIREMGAKSFSYDEQIQIEAYLSERT